MSTRCPRCHQTTPPETGCALCNPERLGQRLTEALAERENALALLDIANSATEAALAQREQALDEVEALRGIYDLVRHHMGVRGSERDRIDALIAIDDIMDNGIAVDGVRRLLSRAERAEADRDEWKRKYETFRDTYTNEREALADAELAACQAREAALRSLVRRAVPSVQFATLLALVDEMTVALAQPTDDAALRALCLRVVKLCGGRDDMTDEAIVDEVMR